MAINYIYCRCMFETNVGILSSNLGFSIWCIKNLNPKWWDHMAWTQSIAFHIWTSNEVNAQYTRPMSVDCRATVFYDIGYWMYMQIAKLLYFTVEMYKLNSSM